ncbi:MAG TPA: sigma-54-dependent Fis family transcriptional regulator [Candidatus Polarisedimenticolaceae bacterium]|nr:sigma-54-dependent Fis family transcriptional regulator [Candidatus Polarisedimenticolaceae bacterium]
MRASDLNLQELLEFDPGGGPLRWAGRRVLILDVLALGLLRKELIATVGERVARGILTRMGYAHGWALAQELQGKFAWDAPVEWRNAGARVGPLQGWGRHERIPRDPAGEHVPLAETLWHDSYEAEQHVLHFGRSEEPACWTYTGFASGYLSFCHQREVYVLEKQCAAQGHPTCHVVGEFKETWGEAIEPYQAFYRREEVDSALQQVTAQLRSVEEQLRRRRRELQRTDGPEAPPVSPAMRRALELARRIAGTDTRVLITGESGVGKERIARLVHEQSPRRERRFVPVNCGAIPGSLLESELFGHARGAFTGAAQERAGVFEAAHGGTLFLDEIGEMPLSTQVALLRVLQEGEIRRVGESLARKVDVRVLAATNRSLQDEVEAGRFRKDLYYRLRVVEIQVPPLRERRDEILELARTFIRIAAERMRSHVVGLTQPAAQKLLAYAWPGNIRELENAMEWAVALAQGPRIEVEDLPPELSGPLPAADHEDAALPLERVERRVILAALRRNEGNRDRTARQLGISTATLWRKLKRYQADGDLP